MSKTRVGQFRPRPIPDEWAINLAAAYTLTSTTSKQAMFSSATVGNAALALPLGLYRFDCIGSLSSMSATSGNAAFDLLGNGTAGLATIAYLSQGIDNAANALGNWQNVLATQAATPASLCNAAINTTLQFAVRGMFRVTVPGTVIPSLSLVTAAAAVVAAGSFFTCKRLSASPVAECVGAFA